MYKNTPYTVNCPVFPFLMTFWKII